MEPFSMEEGFFGHDGQFTFKRKQRTKEQMLYGDDWDEDDFE